MSSATTLSTSFSAMDHPSQSCRDGCQCHLDGSSLNSDMRSALAKTRPYAQAISAKESHRTMLRSQHSSGFAKPLSTSDRRRRRTGFRHDESRPQFPSDYSKRSEGGYRRAIDQLRPDSGRPGHHAQPTMIGLARFVRPPLENRVLGWDHPQDSAAIADRGQRSRYTTRAATGRTGRERERPVRSEPRPHQRSPSDSRQATHRPHQSRSSF